MSRAYLEGMIRVPGDKSITHRALLFSAFAKGKCEIRGISPADDCRRSASCLQDLGLTITNGSEDGAIVVESPGIDLLTEPLGTLFAGNSGTTIRLLSGLLSGLPFKSRLDGDDSLRKRPMARVLEYLEKMGAQVNYQGKAGCAPFSIDGGKLSGIEIQLALASAQVQTSILLAGLSAEGTTTVQLPAPVRDHTERMFSHIGIPYKQESALRISVNRLASVIPPFQITVPADMSSAAFFMVGAACLPGSQVELIEVGINPGRKLVLDVLNEMGAAIEVRNAREICGEPVADILVRYSGRLKGATVDGAAIAAGIDEIPVLALAGAFCDGVFSVRGAGELRVKESDRLKAIVSNMQAAGADVSELADGFDITGKENLKGDSSWQTFADHRLAMTGLLATHLCDKPISVDDKDCVAVSYPNFAGDLEKLLKM